MWSKIIIGQEKKVHRRDMKEIDSDVKIAELYKELRDEGMRDEKHCMPIKQIPDLGWNAPEAAKATPTRQSRQTVAKIATFSHGQNTTRRRF